MENQDKNNSTEPQSIMSNKKFAFVLANPILAPIVLCAVMIFLMMIACGWFFVITVFLCVVGSVAAGILGIVGAFYNLPNGIGATLLMMGSGMFALGFAYPLFCIAKEFLGGYRILSGEIFRKGMEIRERMFSYVKQL